MTNNKAKNPLLKLFIIAILGFCINYIFNVLLSQQLNPATYGDLSFGITLVTSVSILTVFGRDTTIIKVITQLHIEKKPSEEDHFLRWCLKSSLISILILLAGCITLILLSLIIKSVQYFHLEKIHVAIWILPAASIYTLLQIILPFYSANGRAILQETIFVDLYPLCFIVILFIITVIVDVFQPYHGIIVYHLGILLILLLAIATFTASIHPRKMSHLNKGKADSSTINSWQKKSRQYFIGSFFQGLLFTLCYIIIETGSLIPGSSISEESVGHFAAIVAITSIIYVIDTSIYNNILPQISELYRTKEKQITLMSLISKATLTSLAFACCATLIIVFFRKPLLSLFGPGYVAVSIPLIIYCIHCICVTFGSCMSSQMSYLGYQKITNKIEAFCCVLLIILGYILSYYYDLLGLTIAAAITLGLRTAIFYAISKKILDTKPLGFI